MYGVVQFATSEGGTTAIVVKKWLTPRKTEVYWPPVKESKKFDQLLHKCSSPDHTKWKLYDIERVFCETENAISSLALSLLSPDDIVQLFPVLGHRIIFKRNWEEWCKLMHPATVNSDFESLYPEKTGKLTDSFPILKIKLFELAEKRKSKNQTLTSMISKKNSPENTSNAAALLLIPLLLSVATIPLKSNKEKKRSWRPSKAEIQEGFITVLKTDTDLNQVVEQSVKFQNFGLTLQPFVIIVATDLEHIQSYYAVVDEVFYCASNVLNAVDICFKIFWAFNAQYPAECKSTWLFIEKAVYEIDSPKQSTASNTLLTELGFNV